MTATRIVLISTGGTVSARTTADGAVPALSGHDLLGTADGDHLAFDEVEVTTTDLMSVDSSAMSVADQFAIAATVRDALADPAVTGVVVTHGTDTMEESAYLVDLFHTDDRPVVFTGAQHTADSPTADGPRNIADAIRAVATADHRGRGVLVAMGGRIHSARGLFKSSTTALEAFDTVHDAIPRVVLDVAPPATGHVRVDSFGLYPGVSPGLIAAAMSQHAAGIVLAGTGSGNTHPDITAEVSAAVREGIAVVVSTRVPFGRVVPTYGGGGGGVDLERAGAMVSRWLRPPQARIALVALLSTGATTEEVRGFFARIDPA
ncbi:asparaginase [Gordonia aquimaris]|jgi:L-asparaginase|uniref:asparaginase n=1 Tax=Gordonia aquimaris TaxID=2984863 RepID=A0A9X3I470_9ACTN|nr:asparaginase [Gordonia aquimaris]MCX2963896.1 asparaginase [Gordonia aquimaris]